MSIELPTKSHILAWAALVKWIHQAVGLIERDLAKSKNISLTWYDVLIAIHLSPEKRLPMSEVARQIVLSKSGLCRSVEKLLQQDYLEKTQSLEDKRIFYLSVTEKGKHALRKAWPIYQKGIQQYFGQFLSEKEASDIALIAQHTLDS